MAIDRIQIAAQIRALQSFGNVSPRAFARLLQRYGSLDEVLTAPADQLTKDFEISAGQVKLIESARKKVDTARVDIERLENFDTQFVSIFEEEYPLHLREIHDPPPILYYRGSLPDNTEKILSFVGAEKPDADGITVAVKFAQTIAERGVALVTRFSEGIDSAALVGATDTRGEQSGKVFAVMHAGFDSEPLYARDGLAGETRKAGALISEFYPRTEAKPDAQLAVNRLVVGLGQAVVVGEVFDNSDSARDIVTYCDEIGKIVFLLVPTNQATLDTSALAELVGLGAIPIEYPAGIDTIINCLV